MEIRCKGEPDVSVYLGFSTLVIIFGVGIGFMVILNLASILTGIGLIALSLFALSKAIRSVSFGEKKITVKYFFGRNKIIYYSQCKKMYKANDGIIYTPFNVLKYENNGKEKKITFVCDDLELKKICDEYFNGFIPKFL
jgi:hypothetical protein